MDKKQYICPKCGFTELYKGTSSDGWNILDFLMG